MTPDSLPCAASRDREPDWEALVIGAGPAGAMAARTLARQGVRTLLVDRSTFPRFKVCGGCLNARSAQLLAGEGLLDAVIARGARPLDRFAWRCRGREATLPLPRGWSLSREAFDLLLIEAACAAGCEFRPQTSARLANEGGPTGFPCVRLQNHEKVSCTTARVVVVADGQCGGALAGERAERHGWKPHIAPDGRVGVGYRFTNLPAVVAPGAIAMRVATPGYVGLVQAEDDSLIVAAAVDAAYLRTCGGPGPAVAGILAGADSMRGGPRLGELTDSAGNAIPWRDAAWHCVPHLTRRRPQVAARQVFVVGDAAGYVEPFTGEGMAWGLTAGRDVAPYVVKALAGGQSGEAATRAWQQTYQHSIARRQRACRRLAQLVRYPRLMAAAAGWSGDHPSWARWIAGPLIRQVCGVGREWATPGPR